MMNKLAVDDLLRAALHEDIGFGDATSEAIFPEDHISRGVLIAKEALVLAGTEVFSRTFALLGGQVSVNFQAPEGAWVEAGSEFASLEGPTRVLLTGERVALNLLQRMSGIATQTQRFVKAVGHNKAVIADTRKTTPGLRMLEKYAVKVGGGKNHRFGLDSMVMIKDNHIKAAGGILPAVRILRSQVSPYLKIEVEVETLAQLQEALEARVDIIMLDNMALDMIEEAVRIVGGRTLVEVSGNVTLDRVAKLAAAGVDIISSGALTHSVKAADISLRLR